MIKVVRNLFLTKKEIDDNTIKYIKIYLDQRKKMKQ